MNRGTTNERITELIEHDDKLYQVTIEAEVETTITRERLEHFGTPCTMDVPERSITFGDMSVLLDGEEVSDMPEDMIRRLREQVEEIAEGRLT